MNKYYIVWTYMANYGTMVRKADSAKAAAESVLRGFSADFARLGNVSVFDQPPAYQFDHGKEVTPDDFASRY